MLYTGKFNVSDMGMRKFAIFVIATFSCSFRYHLYYKCCIFSIYIRFEDTAIAQKYLEMLISQLPIAVAVHLVVYFVFKLYGRVWRYAGSIELVAIVAANIVAALSWYGISIYIDLALPRSLYIFTASILVLFVGGSRLFFRIYSCFINKSKHKFISSKKTKY